MHACVDVRSTCEDLDIISILAAVYFTLEEVCSLDWLAFLYDADNDTVDLSGEIDQFLYLKSTAKELVFQLLGSDINVNIFFQPTKWYFHDLLPPLLAFELLQETKIILIKQVDVVYTVF